MANRQRGDFEAICLYGEKALAACLTDEFFRKSHKKDPRYLFVGMEYASPPYPSGAIDHDLTQKVEKLFKAMVIQAAESSNKKRDASSRVDRWQFMSLEEYAKTLKGTERSLIPPNVWD